VGSFQLIKCWLSYRPSSYSAFGIQEAPAEKAFSSFYSIWTFVLKVGLLHLDSIYPMPQSELELSSVAVEFGMLSMIFLAFIKKVKKVLLTRTKLSLFYKHG
jgi:hypothetical protein